MSWDLRDNDNWDGFLARFAAQQEDWQLPHLESDQIQYTLDLGPILTGAGTPQQPVAAFLSSGPGTTATDPIFTQAAVPFADRVLTLSLDFTGPGVNGRGAGTATFTLPAPALLFADATRLELESSAALMIGVLQDATTGCSVALQTGTNSFLTLFASSTIVLQDKRIVSGSANYALGNTEYVSIDGTQTLTPPVRLAAGSHDVRFEFKPGGGIPAGSYSVRAHLVLGSLE